MSNRPAIRLVSFALATLMTWTLASVIDLLARDYPLDAMQMSAAPAASQVASATPAPRS